MLGFGGLEELRGWFLGSWRLWHVLSVAPRGRAWVVWFVYVVFLSGGLSDVRKGHGGVGLRF